MLRSYLAILIAVGIFASLLGRTPVTVAPPTARDDVHFVQASAASAAPAEASSVASLQDAIQLQRQPNGHFYADVDVNGTQIHMLVDTGASGIALSRDDARRAGIATSIGMNDVVGKGADGNVHGEFVTIDRLELGQASIEKMPSLVLNSGEQSLLGQAFLQKFSSVEIHGDTMTLR